MKNLLLATAALTLFATMSEAKPTTKVNTDIGTVLASESNGLTLYTFRKDKPGKSNCAGSCADAWPPFIASGNTSSNDGSQLIQRADGRLQWANSAGMPLYFWAGDSKRGQASGEGVGGVWDAARK